VAVRFRRAAGFVFRFDPAAATLAWSAAMRSITFGAGLRRFALRV